MSYKEFGSGQHRPPKILENKSITIPRLRKISMTFKIHKPEHSCRTTWNAAIRSNTTFSRHTTAVHAFLRMRRAGLHPDSFALAAVIKSSTFTPTALPLQSLHAFSFQTNLIASLPVAKALMDMYARSGKISDAVNVFDEMDRRDTVSWNVILSGHARLGRFAEAMWFFYSMHVKKDEVLEISAVSVAVILPVCVQVGALMPAGSVHGYVVKTGLVMETLVGNALVSMYAKCGVVMDCAVRVFDAVEFKDVISWNAMIAGFAENGFLKEAMELFFEMVWKGDVDANCATIASVLPLCGFFMSGWYLGKAIHSRILRFGLETDVSVGNALISHYGRVGDIKGADDVFWKMHVRDVVSWNSLIAGHAVNRSHGRVLDLFHELLSTDIKPDSVTLISVLPVCAHLQEDEEGRKIHDHVRKDPVLCQDTLVLNALVSFYGRCGELDNALRTFTGISKKDLISWNAMLTAYDDNEKWDKLIELFKHMVENGIRLDSVTILSVLHGSSVFSDTMIREIHGYCIRNGLIALLAVGNALLSAYAKRGNIKSVFKFFKNMSKPNVVSSNLMISAFANHGLWKEAETVFSGLQEKDVSIWNLMVQAYAQNNCLEEAIDAFQGLQFQGMKPDTMSIMGLLPACASLASVRLVKQCHSYIVRAFLDDIHLKGSLIDAYAKCGSIIHAYKVFTMNHQNDVVTFTAMLSGFAMSGMAEEALGVFNQMLVLGIKPDHVIMTALLSACSHAGLVDEGCKHFKSIDGVHGIKHTVEHYSCVADLLARTGRLKEAFALVTSMPYEANASVWGTILGACKIHGEVEIGRLAAEHLFKIEVGNIGNYVVLSNIYAADGRWDGVEEVRGLMKSKELRKPAGCSWIEVENMQHIFVAGDLVHPQRSFIYSLLRALDRQIRDPIVCGSWSLPIVNQPLPL